MFGPRSSAPWGSVARSHPGLHSIYTLHSDLQDRPSVLLLLQAQALHKPRAWQVWGLLRLQLTPPKKEQLDDKTETVNVRA